MAKKCFLYCFLMFSININYSQNKCDTLKWQCVGMYFCENSNIIDTLPKMQIDPSIYSDLQFKCIYKNMSNQTYFVGEELTVPIYVNISLKDIGFSGYVGIPMKIILDRNIIPMDTITSISDKANIQQYIFDPIEIKYSDNWYHLIDFCRVKAYVDRTTTDGIFSDSIYYTFAYSTDITFKSPENISSILIEKNIICYPNPTTTFLNIKSEIIIENIHIYDYLGRKMKFLEVKNNIFSINVEDLPAGIYIVKINTEQGICIRKVQVVR